MQWIQNCNKSVLVLCFLITVCVCHFANSWRLLCLAKKAAARKSKVTIDPQGILLDAPDFRLHICNN